ncbi:L-2-hydroxyglutarate oxidase, partial [candidate division KSB1 bacterium]|nr:L-2-hydroxyglutarate oxidase [candidate division KSB1 bacterium]
QCGKVVVATREDELPALEKLYRRGSENGLTGLKKITPDEIREIEPNVRGIAGLYVPQTGIVDFVQVCERFADEVRKQKGDIQTNTRFLDVEKRNGDLVLNTSRGKITTKYLINCGGLYSDRIAKKCGVDPGLQIIPFRGEYYEIKKDFEGLVKNLIYPVPDPRFPFLGVHFTRMIHGGIEAGPNAVLAFKREGYKKSSFSIRDVAEYMTYIGFWKMAMKYWKMSVGEYYRSFSKRAFVRALQRLIPEIDRHAVTPEGAGVRAQALEPAGNLVDDFRIVPAEQMIHVLNAPSPAATAAISIGEAIAEKACSAFELG